MAGTSPGWRGERFSTVVLWQGASSDHSRGWNRSTLTKQSLLARIIHDGSSAPHPSLPHTMGEGEGGGPRQARGAARRGNTPPGSSEGGVPPSWVFYKGAGPLVRVGEAGSRAEPAREASLNRMLTDRAASLPAWAL